MVSYRFCRPDDLPLLVRAINECYDCHFPQRQPMTQESFRIGMQEAGLWPSNCMVAMGKDGPVGVSIATKRNHEVLIAGVGVHAEHQRDGHGRHLVTSLRQKLAVLGPERLVAEVSRHDDSGRGFLEAIGFGRESDLWDWERPTGQELPASDLIRPVSWSDLESMETLAGRLAGGVGVAWQRQEESLRGQAESLEGFAVSAGERIEGWVLYRRGGPLVEVLGWGGQAADASRMRLFDLLCRRIEGEVGQALRLPKLTAEESDALGLRALGFSPAAGYYRYSGVAIPA